MTPICLVLVLISPCGFLCLHVTYPHSQVGKQNNITYLLYVSEVLVNYLFVFQKWDFAIILSGNSCHRSDNAISTFFAIPQHIQRETIILRPFPTLPLFMYVFVVQREDTILEGTLSWRGATCVIFTSRSLYPPVGKKRTKMFDNAHLIIHI